MDRAFSAWPSLTLLLVVVLFWLGCRLLAARATLPLRTFLLCFLAGSTACSLAALFLEQVFGDRLGYRQLAYTAGPAIEGIVLALPVLLVLVGLREWKRISVADAVLAGISTGLGFQFVESNLRVLARGDLTGIGTDLSPLLPGVTSALNGQMFYPGHALQMGLLAFAAFMAVRFLKPWLAIVPAVLALGWITLDHSVFNWALTQEFPTRLAVYDATVNQNRGIDFFVNNHLAPSGFVGVIYQLGLHGRLEVIVLTLGVIAAQIIEGRTSRHFVRSSLPYLLAPGEQRQPSSVTEVGIALAQLSVDGAQSARTMTYFRHRRAATLAAAAAIRQPSDQELQAYSRAIAADVAIERSELDAPMPHAPSQTGPRSQGISESTVLRRNAVGVLLGLLVLVCFMLGTRLLPSTLSRTIYGVPAAVLLVLGSALYALWRTNRFPINRGSLQGARPEDNIGYYLGAALLVVALLTVAMVVLGSVFQGQGTKTALVTDALGEWAHRSGRVEVLYGLAALLCASVAPVGPPRWRPWTRW